MAHEQFGKRLTFAVDHSGLEPNQVANLTGLTLGQLTQEMASEQRITATLDVRQLAQLCQVLHVSWAWLVEGATTSTAQAAVNRMKLRGTHVLSESEMSRVCELLEAIG